MSTTARMSRLLESAGVTEVKKQGINYHVVFENGAYHLIWDETGNREGPFSSIADTIDAAVKSGKLPQQEQEKEKVEDPEKKTGIISLNSISRAIEMAGMPGVADKATDHQALWFDMCQHVCGHNCKVESKSPNYECFTESESDAKSLEVAADKSGLIEHASTESVRGGFMVKAKNKKSAQVK